jgi:hypothetical protein
MLAKTGQQRTLYRQTDRQTYELLREKVTAIHKVQTSNTDQQRHNCNAMCTFPNLLQSTLVTAPHFSTTNVGVKAVISVNRNLNFPHNISKTAPTDLLMLWKEKQLAIFCCFASAQCSLQTHTSCAFTDI